MITHNDKRALDTLKSATHTLRVPKVSSYDVNIGICQRQLGLIAHQHPKRHTRIQERSGCGTPHPARRARQ
jgi:hypothetical protein